MEDVQKPTFPENEVPDYSPVFGRLPARLTTKLLQRLGFTARESVLASWLLGFTARESVLALQHARASWLYSTRDRRTRHTCTESSGGHGCGKLIRGATGHDPAFSSG